MVTFSQYVRAQSLEEAYTLYQKKNNVVIGGMLWTKMQSRPKGTAIDLCDLGLDKIEETESEFRIGAMVSLREIEQHAGLNAYTDGAAADSVKHIVGVQFRNVATVGGSIYGRFGFSDVMTMFMALDAKVELFKAGVIGIREFAVMPRSTRDILVRVIVPKTEGLKTAYQSMRLTKTDFPVLTCAVTVCPEGAVAVIGATPHLAKAFDDEKGILKAGVTEESAAAFAEDVAERCSFGSNLRASEAYRKTICKVLVRRALLSRKEAI